MAKQDKQKSSANNMAVRIAGYERRQKRSMHFALGASLILLLIGVLWMLYSYTKVQSLNEEYSALQEKIRSAKTEQVKAKESNPITNTQSIDPALTPAPISGPSQTSARADAKRETDPQEPVRRIKTEQVKSKPAEAKQVKVQEAKPVKNPEGNRQSAKAEEELKKLLQSNRITKNLMIEYYRKPKDQDKVRVSIKQLGYTRLEEKKSSGPLKDTETNCIFYGSRVPPADVKAVSLSLIKAGFRIRKISAFQHLTGKKDVIQIIGVKYPEGSAGAERIVTVEDIVRR